MAIKVWTAESSAFEDDVVLGLIGQGLTFSRLLRRLQTDPRLERLEAEMFFCFKSSMVGSAGTRLLAGASVLVS
jgi:hypothetical protein